MLKRCNKCGKDKQLSEFRRQKSLQDGRQPACKLCMRIYARSRSEIYADKANVKSRERRWVHRDWLHEYRSNHPCVNCGESCPYCLDFHHVDPSTKSFGVSDATGRGLEIIKVEVLKCIILCRNCHAKFHAGLIDINITRRVPELAL